jgi:hypothetical protein
MCRPVRVLLVLCLLAMNCPEAFCCCGPRGGVAGRTAAKCPFCRVTPTAPLQKQRPTSCCCDTCRAILGVPPGPAVSVPAPAPSGYLADLAAALAALPLAACLPVEEGRALGPPGFHESPGRAIPIFLGHLLI